MSKHTPGPWLKADRLNGPWWHISSRHTIGGEPCISGRQAIACVHGESKKGSLDYAKMFEANARLIAAAPELLESLKAMVDTWERGFNYSDAHNEIGNARAAIAKAEGQS